jgi:hypothetical protein
MPEKTPVQTEHGLYIPLSQRLPEFLEAYPPSQGYGIEIEVVDMLAIKPGLRSLYEAAIKAGITFKSAGLPPLPSPMAIIVRAYLTRNGTRLASAQTYQLIEWLKDLEIAETRARQRLVAALGFNGAVLDYDELTPPSSTTPVQHSAPAEPEPGVPTAEAKAETTLEHVDPVSSAPVATSASSVSPTDLTPALRSQVAMKTQMLRAAGVDVVDPANKREALELLRQPVPVKEAS